MTDKTNAEHFYLRIALSEALRVIARDHGDAYVNQMIDAVFRTHNVQELMLDAFDKMPSKDIDANGREVVEQALSFARASPNPLI